MDDITESNLFEIVLFGRREIYKGFFVPHIIWYSNFPFLLKVIIKRPFYLIFSVCPIVAKHLLSLQISLKSAREDFLTNDPL